MLEAAVAPAGGPGLCRRADTHRGTTGRGALVRRHRPAANGERAAKKNAEVMSVAQQRALVAQPDPGSSVQARCQALGLLRSSFYYQPCGEKRL